MRFDKIKFINFYVPALLFAISFVWKLFYIDARDICLDEPFTIFHAQSSVIDIIKLPSKNEPNPPLFMLLLHFWIKLFGISPYSVRILPILFNAITAVFIYLTGKRFFGLWSGITASGMFILSTYHFYFGADTRTYSMLSMATAASLYYLFSLVKNPEKKKYLVALIISNLVLVYGHYFGWLVVFMELTVGVFYFQNRDILKKTGFAVLATVILYLPMFAVMINQFFVSRESTWVDTPQGFEYLHQIQSFINSKKGLRILGYLLASGVVLSFFTKPNKAKLKELIVLFLWWFLPYSFMFLISYKIPMFTDRYILFNSIGFYLFTGVAISYLFQKIRFLVPLLSIGMFFLMQWYMETHDYAPRKVKMAANYVHSKTDNSSIIVIYSHWSDLEFMYHYDNEIFKLVDNYEEQLEKNNIYRSWGVEDTKNYVSGKNPQKIIFYNNNTLSIDPEKTLFNYFEDNFERTDSAHFEKGIEVSVFVDKEIN
jgi:hypothetical protein